MLPRVVRWLLLTITAAVAVAGASCTRANPAFCASDMDCGDGTICDEDGSLFMVANQCVEVVCVPDAIVRCADSNNEVVCAADGQSESTRECGGFGCNAVRGACNECTANTKTCGPNADSVEEFVDCRADGTIAESRECLLGCSGIAIVCIDVQPSNGLDVDLDFIDNNAGDVRNLDLRDSFTIDSDSGEIRDAEGDAIEAVSTRVQGQAGEEDILVFRVRRLIIEGDVAIIGARAVAFVSDQDIEINGLVDVTAGDITLVDPCVGGVPSLGNGDASGGAGAGFGQNGASGGNADAEPGGGGGSQAGNPELVPLRGGCRGGIDPPSGPFSGGLGGGALQLVTRQRIIFGPSGRISAAGKGGGYKGMVTPGAASGGGSGGGVLLEAPELTFAGGSFVSANGGGGGCQGAVGERGLLLRDPAAGADCGGAGPIGNGGSGGAATSNANPGMSAAGTNAHGGGGGGGVGRIRVNRAPGGGTPNSTFFSPDPTVGDIGLR